MRFFGLFLMLVLVVALLRSQPLIQENEFYSDLKDTFCFKYDFEIGDTLIYNVTAFDSIIIDYGGALIKERNETLKVTCDSIIDGNFLLKLKTTSIYINEANSKSKNTGRKSHPWVDQEVYLLIDSIGNRLKGDFLSEDVGVLSAGGPFHPILFYSHGDNPCKVNNQSWFISTKDTLFENGFPHPTLEHSTLFRVDKPIDTLGYSSIRYHYIRTGNGEFLLNTPNDKIYNFVIINSAGNVIMSEKYKIPVHNFSTMEQKLTIEDETGTQIPGWHYISVYFTLIDFKSSRIVAETEE